MANELFIGQSAVSHQLARLRNVFEDELLVRTAKGMKLTPFAEQIYPEVESILMSMEKLLTRQEEKGVGLCPQKPVYRVCLPDDVYMNDIAILLSNFTQKENFYGKTMFEVFNRYDGCINDLNTGKIDFFFGQVSNLSRQVCSSPLMEFTYSLSVRPDHMLAGQTASAKTLGDYPMIEVIYKGQIETLAHQIFGDVTNKMRVLLRTSSTDSAIHLVKHSDALCLLPDKIIEKYGLTKVLVRGKLLSMPTFMYWHQIMNSDPFHAHVREHLLQAYVENNFSIGDLLRNNRSHRLF